MLFVVCRARAVRPHWTPTTAPSASPLLPTVRERSRPNTDDLTTSAVLEGRLSRTFVTLSNVRRCLIMSVLAIGHDYTGLTGCQLALGCVMVLLKQRFALARVNVTDPAIVTVRRIGRQYRG